MLGGTWESLNPTFAFVAQQNPRSPRYAPILVSRSVRIGKVSFINSGFCLRSKPLARVKWRWHLMPGHPPSQTSPLAGPGPGTLAAVGAVPAGAHRAGPATPAQEAPGSPQPSGVLEAALEVNQPEAQERRQKMTRVIKGHAMSWLFGLKGFPSCSWNPDPRFSMLLLVHDGQFGSCQEVLWKYLSSRRLFNDVEKAKIRKVAFDNYNSHAFNTSKTIRNSNK